MRIVILNVYNNSGESKKKCQSLGHVRLWDPMDCSLSGPSVHGILQARILEWVAIPFFRASTRPRDWIQVSCIARRFFTVWATKEVYNVINLLKLSLVLDITVPFSKERNSSRNKSGMQDSLWRSYLPNTICARTVVEGLGTLTRYAPRVFIYFHPNCLDKKKRGNAWTRCRPEHSLQVEGKWGKASAQSVMNPVSKARKLVIVSFIYFTVYHSTSSF